MDEYPIVRETPVEVIEQEEFERLYTAPTEIVVLLSLFYGSISVVAVIGNTLVIWVVVTTRQMHTVTNMYIANLASADVIIGLFSIPFEFQAALLQRWNLPFFMCGLCPFMQILSVNVSVFTLTAIAVDRHGAIINPLRARPSKYVSKFIIAGIWVFSFLFALPCAFVFRVEVIEEFIKEDDVVYNATRPFCMNKHFSENQLLGYRYFLVFVQYVVPFCVISFVYIQMAVKLWGTRAPGNAQDTRDLALLRNKKKVIKMLIIVVIVFGLCWLPLQLYNILHVTIPEVNDYRFINIVWFCCDWLAMSNSCYNPFIYGIYNEKFKREFKKRFARCLCKSRTTQFDMNDRNVSMHTRASSVRSTYVNSSMRVRSRNITFAAIEQNPQPLTPQQRRQKLPLNLKDSHPRKMHSVGSGCPTGKPPTFDLISTYTDGGGSKQSLDMDAGNLNSLYSEPPVAVKQEICLSAFTGYEWRRNAFRPLHPDLIELEHDLRSIAMLESSSSDDIDITVAAALAAANEAAAIDAEALLSGGAVDLRNRNDANDNDGIGIAGSDGSGDDSGAGSTCICEKELGGGIKCDRTCILREVLRVQTPAQPTATDAPAVVKPQSINSII